MTIADRIKQHFVPDADDGSMSYYKLLNAVFPEAEYPKAMRFSPRGGPPGCNMAASAALRRMGPDGSWTETGFDEELCVDEGHTRLPDAEAAAIWATRPKGEPANG